MNPLNAILGLINYRWQKKSLILLPCLAIVTIHQEGDYDPQDAHKYITKESKK